MFRIGFIHKNLIDYIKTDNPFKEKYKESGEDEVAKRLVNVVCVERLGKHIFDETKEFLRETNMRIRFSLIMIYFP